ncbi:glycoside hydrolase family 3 N-terminal domain-containing protein [Demequina zhanjiangensis]|uniref:beta-glucosidase n=1 Tax=Demequina zhanjiangensis TaxID=3051659 RepID=A0ABT8G015_9MICO|nr:glycoside hydrolase family 3 N-terminal domain-containing protein [Demequina sp. SYSU T00b26]MDN4472442.1 glycoside hydrolase family 3 N-terminal domain-containing protein [Demequina sp. SYSU T00b26]
MTAPLYLDSSRPTPERVADLVSRMTLPEKVGQMMQMHTYEGVDHLIDDWHVGSILHASPENLAKAHALADRSRLGIPLLVGEDCIHGHSFFKGATIFPTQLGMAASFDPELLRRVGRATAREVSTTGIHWTFSPVLCISRDLRWGRVSETFGEDPWLIGELASGLFQGYQGHGASDREGILATAKHFAAYSETQGGRDASEADVSRRKLRSWFLPPFERVAREGCRTFMLGYQAIDGTPITINDWLLNDVLRGEWGYDGMLITDWDNVGNLVREQRLFPGYAEAAAAAVKAGNDMIMTTPDFFTGAQEAVARGLLDESLVDAAVARILTVKFDMGLFEDQRRPDPARQAEVIACEEHTALNLEVARRSIVLLANDGLLPLDRAASPRLAVVGPNADDPDVTLGDWAGASGQADWLMEGHPREQIVTALDGLRAVGGDTVHVAHARGADILTTEVDPAGGFYADGQPRAQIVVPSAPDEALIADAVAVAKAADVAIAVVGDRGELVGEAKSTATLELIGGQQAMLDAVLATGTPTVVVLMASKPHVLPASVHERAAAIVWAANPGMQGGTALAEILFGDVEPTGRLPISFARHVGQQPTFYNQIDAQHGVRYADLTQEPAWVFGEGLSYTTVEYSDLRMLTPEVSADSTIQAEVTVTNTGGRPTLETVQAYVRDVHTSSTWADRELKAVTHVSLEPGEEARVKIAVPVAECAIVDARERRVVEPGEFALLVGPSSRPADLLSAPFHVS